MPIRIRALDTNTVAKLLALNKAFYGRFANAFSASRGKAEPGLLRLLHSVKPGARVLDLGCGNARVAQLLPPGCSYTGIDFSPELLRSTAPPPHLVSYRLLVADLVQDAWAKGLTARFDWIVIRAVLHHIPDYANRRAVLSQAISLSSPDGYLILANWQFDRLPRLLQRAVPWSAIGLSEDDVEDGDMLLDWRRDGYGIRYVHLVTRQETLRLAEESGATVVEMFQSDGRTGDLTLYALLRPRCMSDTVDR